jgi:hypothetical protein
MVKSTHKQEVNYMISESLEKYYWEAHRHSIKSARREIKNLTRDLHEAKKEGSYEYNTYNLSPSKATPTGASPVVVGSDSRARGYRGTVSDSPLLLC